MIKCDNVKAITNKPPSLQSKLSFHTPKFSSFGGVTAVWGYSRITLKTVPKQSKQLAAELI